MNRAGSVLCPIIIGRDDLLALADRRLAEAAAGRGQLLLLAGQAGIGKTRLLGAIGRKAAAAGFLEASGALAPQDRDVPAALIGDLARSVRRNPAFGTLGDDLLAMRVDRDADALGSRRLYVLDVVDRLVAAIDRPVLLDFEDLQWADEVSLEIVGDLARAARGRPLLMVGNYRTEELAPGSFFREWRARLIGQRLAEEARLAPLTLDDTALMTTLLLETGLPAPREVVAAVQERTDGIPLHIEELLGVLRGESLTDGGAILDARVPETIEDAIVARLDQLSPEAREVARAGAVIGRCFVPEVLAGIMDRPVSELDRPLRELTEHSYLLPAGSRGLIDFRHQLLRDVLYRQVPPTELRRLHARAGEFGAALEGHSEIHASVHFERAGLREEAFRAALTGADAASRISARQESFELYRRAIENMPDDLPVLEQAELYAMFSNAAAAIEHNAESIAAADEARTRYLEAGRPVEAADMHLQIASMPYREARPVRDVVRDLDVVLAEIEALPEGRDSAVLRAAAYDMKAFLELDGSMVDESIVDSKRALELAERIGDRETALDATLTAARIDIRSGRLEQGFQRGFSAAREARDAGYESVGVTAFRNLAISAVRVLDYRTAELALGEGLRYADAIEQSHCRQQMATATALMSWATGRWDEAVETARQELVERGCRRGELSAIDVLGVVAMSRGEMGEARRWYDELLDAGEAMQEVSVLLPALWGLAEADLIAGDPNSAADRTSKALEIAIRSGDGALLIPLVVTGVRARLAIHRPDEAERWLARARDQLAGWTPVADAALAHAAGLVLLATGSMTAARESLQAAVRGWDDLGRVWETSWARLDLAQCLMRSSRYGEAANLLATVRETAESLGSGPLLGRADDLSRVARGRGTMEEPWRPLTAREFEVARLIAEGLTNGEIAQRLDIAPKTASAHVEHILAKLGVMRRAEIAAWTATVLRPEGRNGDGSVATGTSQRPPERRAAAVR